MRKLRSPSLAAALLLASAAAPAADPAHGKQVFELWCSSCHKRLDAHDKPVAGTSSLARKYQGSLPAALEDRTDLTGAYVKALVRVGTKSMPPARKTEISDSELADLVSYLAKR